MRRKTDRKFQIALTRYSTSNPTPNPNSDIVNRQISFRTVAHFFRRPQIHHFRSQNTISAKFRPKPINFPQKQRKIALQPPEFRKKQLKILITNAGLKRDHPTRCPNKQHAGAEGLNAFTNTYPNYQSSTSQKSPNKFEI